MQHTLTATSSVSWSFISISLHSRVTLVAIITPPCPSFRSFLATMWWLLGSSEFKMFGFSHVSVPIIMSGSELFIRFSNTSRLLQMFWKLIVSTFSSFIFFSTNCFDHDECMVGPGQLVTSIQHWNCTNLMAMKSYLMYRNYIVRRVMLSNLVSHMCSTLS